MRGDCQGRRLRDRTRRYDFLLISVETNILTYRGQVLKCAYSGR
jgi:hypothetical protein